ncbi:hypothetical protein FS749_003501 [Ceratobasidium sp. UAMH 11750]|nr:hypothetical protein FS749_003501 [Ceratobasidium sp. UAMH 11750]
MKLSAVPAILATAAGLVNAVPVRIYVFKPSPPVRTPDIIPSWSQSIRWGHAAAPAFNLPPLEPTMPSRTYLPAPMYRPNPTYSPNPTGFPLRTSPPDFVPDPDWSSLGERLKAEFRGGEIPRVGCQKGMRAKSLQWGNKFRVVFGLPPIHSFESPSYAVESLVDGNGAVIYRKVIPAHPLPTHHHHHTRPSHHRPSFMVRLTHALASLGPWEGRAVSFVLGCGLGVLLRMLFVFAVLIVRSVRARRAERQIVLEQDSVIFVADVKEPIVVETLPAYAEKVEAEEVPQTNNAH